MSHQGREPRRLRVIGYWVNHRHPEYPDPRTLIDDDWDEEEREDVWHYLRHGLVVRAYMGLSECRLCGERVGSLELTDFVFAWPEGLAHYVKEHGVRLPDGFVEHIQSQESELDEADLDLGWWLDATSAGPDTVGDDT